MIKKFALVFLLFSGVAYAGLVGNALDSAATKSWPTKPTSKYKLEMYGFDARAYEFNTDNGMKCVAVYSGGEQKGFQMSCIAK